MIVLIILGLFLLGGLLIELYHYLLEHDVRVLLGITAVPRTTEPERDETPSPLGWTDHPPARGRRETN